MASDTGSCQTYTTSPGCGHTLEIETPPGDDIGRRIERRGLPYEWEELAISHSVVSKSVRVIDVGANVGNHSMYWAVHSGAEVEAFEPEGMALDMLRRNIERNGLSSKIAVNPTALGAVAGRGRLREKHGNLGASHLEMTAPADDLDGSEVSVACLDSYSFRNVGLIKIDVEGMEIDVIRGARETLRRERPVVWAELLTSDAARVVQLELTDLGYWRRPIMLGETNALFISNRSQAFMILRSPLAVRLLARRAAGRRFRLLRDYFQRRGVEVPPG